MPNDCELAKLQTAQDPNERPHQQALPSVLDFLQKQTLKTNFDTVFLTRTSHRLDEIRIFEETSRSRRFNDQHVYLAFIQRSQPTVSCSNLTNAWARPRHSQEEPSMPFYSEDQDPQHHKISGQNQWKWWCGNDSCWWVIVGLISCSIDGSLSKLGLLNLIFEAKSADTCTWRGLQERESGGRTWICDWCLHHPCYENSQTASFLRSYPGGARIDAFV